MGILICGLNGAGKSTLGKALASCMGYDTGAPARELFFDMKKHLRRDAHSDGFARITFLTNQNPAD